MSELKVYSQCYDGTDGLFYLKSEADRYIGELEEKHKMEVEQLLLEITQVKRAAKILRKKMNHNKYKRCLAMAKWCESKVYHIRRTPLCDMDEHEGWQHYDEFWQRWQKRWMELAEVFKETK